MMPFAASTSYTNTTDDSRFTLNEPSSAYERCDAVAWDPKSPATLMVPTVADDGDGEKESRMDTIVSDRGVSCNIFESSALMKLMDHRDAYMKSGDVGAPRALRKLSRNYRKVLRECIHEWNEDIEMKEDQEGGDGPALEVETPSEEKMSLELLRVTEAVTQLSETFLLLPSVREEANGTIFDYYEDTVNLPGAVTADTIRYLRVHSLGDAIDIFEDSVLEEIQNSYQPDQYNGGKEYWELVEAHLIRGCLEDAWELLSNHSSVRRLEDMDNDPMGSVLDDYQAVTLDDEREGFQALKDILLSAPLPGGRSSQEDLVYCAEDDDNEDGKGGQQANRDTSVVEEEYIEGIPISAYRLWETNDTDRGSGDFPVNFDPHAAYQVYQLWKESVDGIPALQRLRRRIPELNRVLCLLSGDFRYTEFDSWQEELCAELLYKIPNIRLVDMSTRTALVMKKFSDPPKEFDLVILNIMKGNAGRVIQIMYDFLAGGSMAALPAVMTSLLCQILDDAQILTNVSDKYSLNLELLIGASFAIRSSLAIEGHHDLGSRLAVRMLLPFITIDSDVRITATLANILEHHFPNSDAEANSLLVLCQKLVERKNVRVLDGCVSICLARYQHYLHENRPGGAVHWLLTGMDLEALVLCDGPKRSGAWQRALSSGVCYRRLFAYFTETSQLLLKTLIGDGKGASLLYARAKEMVTAKEESNFASFVPAVKLLENVVLMAGVIAERKEDAIVASSIVTCLEERANEEDDGTVSSLARPSMHWDLLRLATVILDRDARRADTQETDTQSISSFDVRGMGVLLSSFTVVSKTDAIHQDSNATLLPEDLQQTRRSLGEGLKRAFVAENAMIKSAVSQTPRTSVVGVYAANFARHSREDQERAVKMMLEY